MPSVWTTTFFYQIQNWKLIIFPYTDKYDSILHVLSDGDDYECYYNMVEALKSIDEFLVQENGAALQDHFNLCHPVNTANEKEMTFFYEILMEFIFDYIRQFQ